MDTIELSNAIEAVNEECANLLTDPCTPGFAKDMLTAIRTSDTCKVLNVLHVLTELARKKEEIISNQ